MNDYEVCKLGEAEEAMLCEALAPIIEAYGLATVRAALTAIKEAGAWGRT